MTPDRLHWTESDIERIDVNERTLTVVASKVFVLGEHCPRRLKVTFHGVCRAELEVTEYIGPPQAPLGFEEPRRVHLVPRSDAGTAKTFALEGISTFDPIAWIDLELDAEGAVIEEVRE
ncbi:hypothetical protein OOT46_07385 [Aquabacterium sp. A7-Y]|uniref:hypothetical protein n=1 Tax=Aquabacterium sp. A7-Y TaxID=1349605 RepID=UPI00223E6F48|nr:hypothetical protein [Aquabacterium sp. A7-Y]MCW7537673.1 hypothetical protein [Aquabacterium sp. A7-Y]